MSPFPEFLGLLPLRALIYMSIHDEIKARCQEGGLYRLASLMTGTLERRGIYVTPELSTLIHGPWSDHAEERRWGAARAYLDQFITGRLIILPAGTWHNHAYMGRLDKPEDEVWDFRIKAPRPGMRLFGRFAAKDLMVVVTWAERSQFRSRKTREGRKDWNDAIRACQVAWRNLFPTYDPLNGAYPDDYLSNFDTI